MLPLQQIIPRLACASKGRPTDVEREPTNGTVPRDHGSRAGNSVTQVTKNDAPDGASLCQDW